MTIFKNNIKNDYSFFIAFVDLSIEVDDNAAISSHRLRVIADNVTVFSKNVNQIRKSLKQKNR